MLRKYKILGEEFVIDDRDFQDFLNKLKRGAMYKGESGIVTSLTEFDRLPPEKKLDYLKGYMMYKGDWVPTDKKPSKKTVQLRGAHGEVEIPLPV